MGRRKIEIQPITHERNRAVTFLKRKNGLFKKAYELGVLCSVDVAVIIFEERPGHHVKLYQYCSADIHDIVDRHVRHDGEKDTRGPQDFAGNTNTKTDDVVDGDDDDQDDDDDAPSKRRGGETKLKRGGSDLAMSTDVDFMHNRGLSIPQPPLSMHGIGSGSALPISSDRHLPRAHPHHKRPRTDHPSLHNRSPSDDHLPSGSAAYHYPPGSGASFHRGTSQYQQHHSGNTQYTPLYPVSNHTTPPPVFIPLQPEFTSSSSRAAAPRSGGPGPPPAFSTARSNSANSSYDSSMYPSMMRPPPSGSRHPGGGGGSGGGSGGDLFTAFLDADEHSRQSQNQSFGLDWPVHNSTAGSGPPSSNPVPPPVSNSSANSSSGPNEGGSNWLDFLSGSNNPSSSGRDPSMSWERSGGDNRADINDMFNSGGGSGGGGSQATSPLSVAMGEISGSKRRVDSEDATLATSPGSLSSMEKKELKPEGGG